MLTFLFSGAQSFCTLSGEKQQQNKKNAAASPFSDGEGGGVRDYHHPGEDADETENPVYGLPQKHGEDGGEAGNVWRHMKDRLPLRTTNSEIIIPC